MTLEEAKAQAPTSKFWYVLSLPDGTYERKDLFMPMSFAQLWAKRGIEVVWYTRGDGVWIKSE